ncbi:hypothetical protein HPB48_009859 [Haemaphysalis longicornis]|uniref:Uncharacterized protein n=1 Tax=Haemaphysalis longicornis TaxID=44386 RepID=A0A9J6GKH3_HAELO|nr:hypothetical protein HPB48_009859 [Haemaphysalis longicornis]
MQNRSEIPNPKRDRHASLNIPVIRLSSRSKNGSSDKASPWRRTWRLSDGIERPAATEEVVVRSFKRCGISTALGGSEDGELHERLASAVPPSAALPTTSNSVREELVDLLFGSESDCSLYSFDDE